jgi:hypothetical protein
VDRETEIEADKVVMRRPMADVSHWDAKAPITTIMDVPGETWQVIADRYRPERKYGARYRALHALVRSIQGAWWSRGLHAHTSMYTVVIAQTAPFDMYGRNVLRVEPRRDEMHFSFGGWETSCPEDEAFAKLEHILRNRLKWIVGEPPR